MSWFQGPGILRAGSVSWLTGTLDGTEPSFTEFVSPLLFLLWQARMSAVKKVWSWGIPDAELQAHILLKDIFYLIILLLCIFWLQHVFSWNLMGLWWREHAPSHPTPLCTTEENCGAEAAAVPLLWRLPDIQLLGYLDLISLWQLDCCLVLQIFHHPKGFISSTH